VRLGRNDPCHCGSGKKYKVCHLEADAEARRAESDQSGRADGPAPEIPDPRVFERSTAEVVRMFEARSRQPRRAAEAAQELMYEAWEQRSPAKRIALAREALAVHEGCVDALSLLASEEARTDEEARDLWERAVKGAEAALGKRAFIEDVGHFWGILETRPYMRARHGLAQCLWHLGERGTAIGHFQELLRLNPNDNQGVRYQLAACLLEAGQDDALDVLLARYADDASAVWTWSAALLEFRQSADSAESRAALLEALDQNPYVAGYLLGEKKLPGHLPDYIGFGDEPEAIAYAAEHGDAWRATRGALDWLASRRGPRAPKPKPTARSRSKRT
jgi:tetratricopeptide (TPR) repeat protein